MYSGKKGKSGSKKPIKRTKKVWLRYSDEEVEQLIIKLMETKTKRETAQYDATPSITREMAKTSLDDADEFITKIEEILG